jgi:hypothetical protein
MHATDLETPDAPPKLSYNLPFMKISVNNFSHKFNKKSFYLKIEFFI